MTDQNLMNLGSDEAEPTNTPDPAAGGGEQNPAPVAGERPEHVPEKFWDKEKGSVRTDDVLKSYTELEKEHAKIKQGPKAPEKYEVKIPEKYADKVEIPDDDPMVVGYKEFAKSKNMTQEQFDANLEFYIDHMNTLALADQEKQIESLGGKEKATATIKGVRTFLKGRLTPESYEVMVGSINTAAQVKAMDEIRKLVSVQKPTPDDPTVVSEELTEQGLRDLMKKPEYYDVKKRDESLVKKVEEGFKKLYGKPKKG